MLVCACCSRYLDPNGTSKNSTCGTSLTSHTTPTSRQPFRQVTPHILSIYLGPLINLHNNSNSQRSMPICNTRHNIPIPQWFRNSSPFLEDRLLWIPPDILACTPKDSWPTFEKRHIEFIPTTYNFYTSLSRARSLSLSLSLALAPKKIRYVLVVQLYSHPFTICTLNPSLSPSPLLSYRFKSKSRWLCSAGVLWRSQKLFGCSWYLLRW